MKHGIAAVEVLHRFSSFTFGIARGAVWCLPTLCAHACLARKPPVSPVKMRFWHFILMMPRVAMPTRIGRFAVVLHTDFSASSHGCSQRYPHAGYAQILTQSGKKRLRLPVDRNGDRNVWGRLWCGISTSQRKWLRIFSALSH